MKYNKKLIALIIAISLTGFSGISNISAETIKDTGLNYTEYTGYDKECSDCGYSNGIWINASPGKEWSENPVSFSLLLIDIGAYSSGINKENKDYELDDAFFRSLEATLKNAEKNDVTVGIRLRYDSNGIQNPEPDNFEMVLNHADQLGQSGLLEKYEETISYIETGLVGAYGEQWGGKYTALSYKAKLLDKFLDITPDSISVSVRTPNTVREWLSTYCQIKTTAENMSAYSIKNPLLKRKAERIGLYNDGYMGSDSDLGTYQDRKGETDWLSTAALYGGEFSGNFEYRLKYSNWLPENALSEMYKTHLSRINGNIYKTSRTSEKFDTLSEAEKRLEEIHNLYFSAGLSWFDEKGDISSDNGKFTASWNWIGYDDFIFNEEIDEKTGSECDNSAFYGENIWQFIRTHLGHRFVLKNMKMNQISEPGKKLNIEFTVENTGFAEASKYKETEIILSDGITSYTFTTDINAAKWLSGKRTNETIDISLPQTISGGEWKVYMRISDLNKDAANDSCHTCRFSNEDMIFDDRYGANLIGTLKIDAPVPEIQPVYENKRPNGYFTESPVSYDITNDKTVSLLDKNYTFEEDNKYGFTFLYKIDGLTTPVQLGNWYLAFNGSQSSYSSAYTTYGLNTMNLNIEENGYYALNIPFFSAVFNYPDASEKNITTLTALNFNDNRNYWSKDTFTDINDNKNLKITPIGFAEGSPSGYNVTFHMPDGDIVCSGKYEFLEKSHQKITNLKAVTVNSLYNKKIPESYRDKNNIVYKFSGFTTKQNDKNFIINDDFIAIGDIELYPYFEADTTATDFSKVTYTLDNGYDINGISYILNEHNMTASVGDGSIWENNSSCKSSNLVIPAFVIQNNKKYIVTAIERNAFGSDAFLNDIILPDTIMEIGENAFYNKTNLHFSENSLADNILKTSQLNFNYLENSIIKGDVNGDKKVSSADLIALVSWMTNKNIDINPSSANMNSDAKINIADLVMLKVFLKLHH